METSKNMTNTNKCVVQRNKKRNLPDEQTKMSMQCKTFEQLIISATKLKNCSFETQTNILCMLWT